MSERRIWIFTALIAFFASVLIYAPSFQYPFTNYDDDLVLYKNAAVTGFHLKKIFFGTVAGADYLPVTTFTLAVEHLLVGLDPTLYRLDNFILYLLNILLMTLFLYRLWPEKYLRIAMVAALFAVHPLHVETVAWITERKGLLSTFFSLAALNAYLLYLENKTQRQFWLVGGLFLLALFSKPVAFVLPILFLLIDWYKGRHRTDRCYLKEKLPFIIVAAALVVWQLKLQGATEHLKRGEVTGLGASLAAAWNSILFYFSKALWPVGLSAYHPRGIAKLSDLEFAQGLFCFTVFGFFMMVLPFFKKFREHFAWRELLLLLSFYTVSIGPTLQFVPIGNYIAYADRYFYFPGIWLIAGVILFLVPPWRPQSVQWASGRMNVPALGVTLIAFVCFSQLSFNRVAVWKTSETLWRDVATKYPTSYLPWFNLGGYYLFELKDPTRALEMYAKAIVAKPDDSPTVFNIGMAYNKLGDPDRALESFLRAREMAPSVPQIHFNIGRLLELKGRNEEAQSAYHKAHQLEPDNAAYAEALRP